MSNTHRVIIQATISYEIFLEEPHLSDFGVGEVALDNPEMWREIDCNSFVFSVEKLK